MDTGRPGTDVPHHPKVVLVTGARRFLRSPDCAFGAEPAHQQGHRGRRHRAEQGFVAADGRAEFVRADIRNCLSPGDSKQRCRHRGPRGGGLLCALVRRPRHPQRAQRDGRDAVVRRLPEGAHRAAVIPRPPSEVYGSHPHDPVVFTEDCSSRRPLGEGLGTTARHRELCPRTLARRRPDISVTIRVAGEHDRSRHGHRVSP